MAVLGIDIGASKTLLALGRCEGEILAQRRWETPADADPQAALDRIAHEAKRLSREQGIDPAALRAVGVCAPGPFDPSRRALARPPNLPRWHGYPLAAALEQRLGAPVWLENDANAAALAEWRLGAGRGVDDVVFLTMSSGVGGGLILGGRLQRGAAGQAGEIGHLCVEAGGEPCACGLRGCLEAYVGGLAWGRRLRALAPATSRLREWAAGDPRGPGPEHALAAARAGDAFACAELERFVRYLARGIAALLHTVAPQRILLGTIAVAAGESLCFAPLRREVERLAWPQIAAGCEILPAALGPDLPAHAGLAVAWQGLASLRESPGAPGPGEDEGRGASEA